MTAGQPLTPGRQALAVWRRDVAVERAGREALVTTVPFVAALVILAGLAFGPSPRALAVTGPGTAWLAVLVATIPLSRAVAGAEVAEDCWDALRGLVAPGPLFAGKVLAVWSGLLLTWLLAGGLVVLLFGVPAPPQAFFGGVVGTLALAALTTGFGLLAAGGARRRGLLAALLLPAGLPALLAGTQLASTNGSVLPWAVLMTVYAAVVVTAVWAVFPALLEE